MQSLGRTQQRREDLFKSREVSAEERQLLEQYRMEAQGAGK